MSKKIVISLLPRLLLLGPLVFPPATPAQTEVLESDVVALLEQMDRHSNQREFDKLKPLISRDATFVLMNNDVDEKNTVIIGYKDYFDGIDRVMARVDEYRITREIVRIELTADRSSARVLTRTTERFVSDGIEDFDRTTGYLDVAFVGDQLVVIGGISLSKSDNKYSLSHCPNNCPELKAVFPNITAIQTDWLDGRYRGLVIHNTDETRSLKRDRALVRALAGNGELYVLFMAPFETERAFYQIDNKRTLQKLLKDNIADFISVQYVDPAEHDNISDYTRYRNSLWLNDQISNLILVIPEQALIIDWSAWDQIGIYSTNDESFERARQQLEQMQVEFAAYEQDWPTFDLYKVYISKENISRTSELLETIGLPNESLSSEFSQMTAESDYTPILVFDDGTDRQLIDQALEMDIMLLPFGDFHALLEQLEQDSL